MPSLHDRTALLALIIGEQRRDLSLSLSEAARVSCVSRATVTRLERGQRVDPALVVRVASALNVLELAAPPRDEATLLDLGRELGFPVPRLDRSAA